MYGERIVQLRKEKGLTQTQLASELGITRSALSLYEIEKREPDTNTLIEISSYFGVSTDYLLGYSDNRISTQELEWRHPHTENRLGTILKKYRIQNKITEDKFVKALGIKKELLSKIELGIYTPSFSLLQKISEITGYDIDFLTGAKLETRQSGGISELQLFESDSHFRARLEEHCLQKGITYENVTEKLGLSKEAYIDITCNRMPTLTELLRISYGLNVSVDYLVGRTDIPYINLTEDEVSLLTDYRDCIEPYKKNIRDRAQRLSIESITHPSTVTADEPTSKTGTDDTGK